MHERSRQQPLRIDGIAEGAVQGRIEPLGMADTGFLIGSAVHGLVADRLGRRGTLLGGLWITSIFTVLTALFADSFLSFCGLRLLTGLGLGVLLPLATTYINELATRRVANTFALWGVGLYWWAGILYAFQVRKLLVTTPRVTHGR